MVKFPSTFPSIVRRSHCDFQGGKVVGCWVSEISDGTLFQFLYLGIILVDATTFPQHMCCLQAWSGFFFFCMI